MADTVVDILSKANSAFVDENYADALNLYNKAAQIDLGNSEVYVKRSHTHFKLENWEAVVSDVDKAFELGCEKNAKLHFRKGLALFHLDKYQEAKEVLEEGLRLGGGDADFGVWIEKCSAEMKLLEEAKQAVVMPPAACKDSTERYIIITIFAKNRKEEDVKAEFTDTTVNITVKLPCGDDYELFLNLAHPIHADRTVIKCYQTKVDIRAQKREGIKWTTLEFDSMPEAASVERAPPVFQAKDWDNIVKENENDREEGDAALNSLFQKIYAEGSDDVRRAMNKSFFESGGTVLSTNWEEIADKTTPIKPPDGMEYRKWTE
ncbi:hypothetical protein MRX96_038655 [Rhipicephalus microplus]